MSDSIDFKVNVGQAQSSLKSLDSTLQTTGKSIEGVKSTMEKVFAAQAIYASASRLADAIRKITDELNATTTALNNLQQSNARGGVGFDKLSEQAKTARDEAKKLREEYDTISGRLSALAKYGSVSGGLQTAANLEREAAIAEKQAQAQKEALQDRKEGVELEDRLLKARLDGEKEMADIRKDMIDQENKATEAGLAAAIKAGEEEAARVMKRDEEARKQKDDQLKRDSEMADAFKNAQSDQAKTNESRKNPKTFDEVKMEMAAQNVQSMLQALAQTQQGQRSGGAREARRAQSLQGRAEQADATGNYYDAEQLRGRAARAEERAANRLDRNEARSLRQQANAEREKVGRKGDIAGPLARAKELEEKAKELDAPGSTKKTAAAGGKSISDVWSILSERLPSKIAK